MKDNFPIQRLTPAGVEHLRALNALFGRVFDAWETYGAQPPSNAYVERLLAKDVIVLALVEESVVGGLVDYELDKFERERREVYIYDLAMAAAHRRQGTASAPIQSSASAAHG